MLINKLKIWLIVYVFLLSAYSFLTYAFVDPNLVLIDNPSYWLFQEWMWGTILGNREIMVSIYVAIISLLFISYINIIKLLRDSPRDYNLSFIIATFLLLISPLIFSYNALSHDVFNYMFNAKMMVEYGSDPHSMAAINFSGDPWVRFMHNVHTTAPYGKLWTWLSVIPYTLGAGKFILTWFAFRAFALFSLAVLYFSVNYLHRIIYGQKLSLANAAILFLNPLLIVEVVSNQHNDLWMMSGAVAGLGLFLRYSIKQKNFSALGLVGLSVWLLSVLVKLSSIALTPLFLLAIIKNSSEKLKIAASKLNWQVFPDMAAILMFIPLFTSRSQQFHPWYLLWPLVWIPVMKNNLLKISLIVFSASSLLRYIPWMLDGNYSDKILFQQRLITWAMSSLLIIMYLLYKKIFIRSAHE